jgi:hypothetical protein
MNKIDFTLGEPKHVPMRANENTPWPVLDFTPTKPEIVTPALASVQGRRGESFDKPYPAPRQTMLSNPLRDDEYLSPADKKYASLHDILRSDFYPGSAEESDAVFSGGGIERANYKRTDPTYDGNLVEELASEIVTSIREGHYGDSTLLSEKSESRDELVTQLAGMVLELSEKYALSPEDILYSMHTCSENKGISLNEFLAMLKSATKEQRLAQVKEFLRELGEAVSANANKVSAGLHGTDAKTKKSKASDGITGTSPVERSAARAIAISSANKKPKKPNNVGNGIVAESVVVVDERLSRLLGGVNEA